MMKHTVAESVSSAWASLNWLLVAWLRCLTVTGDCVLQHERGRELATVFLLPCAPDCGFAALQNVMTNA